MYLTDEQIEQLEARLPDSSQLLSDEPPMETSMYYRQLALLVTGLEWLWREQEDFFVGANLTIYYSLKQVRNRDFRGPDFFLVKDVPPGERKSWVLWEEDGKYPDLIIELLSESTAATDKGPKRELYQNQFRTPEYFWFSAETFEFRGFRLAGSQYAEISPNDRGWCWSEELGLYLGVEQGKLRYFTREETIVPTPEEAESQEQQRADQERQRAERMALYIRAQGIDPDTL